METTSFHGNKVCISVIALLILALCTAAATYRLKKTAEIKRWEKEMIAYSSQLESENLLAVKTAGHVQEEK